MRIKKLMYGVGLFLLLCTVGLWGLWFAYFRPIIPKGEAGELQFEKRAYQHYGIDDGEYEIGVFFVPENRSNPNSRVIAIDYARFLAKEEKGPPIFVLPGGPGNTYINSDKSLWLGAAPVYLENLRAFSDVVLVNQRGYNPRRRDILLPIATNQTSSQTAHSMTGCRITYSSHGKQLLTTKTPRQISAVIPSPNVQPTWTIFVRHSATKRSC